MQTPTKYLFPSFEATHWYAAEGLIQDLQTLNATSFVPAYLIKGLKSLVNVLKLWLGEKDVRNKKIKSLLYQCFWLDFNTRRKTTLLSLFTYAHTHPT